MATIPTPDAKQQFLDTFCEVEKHLTCCYEQATPDAQHLDFGPLVTWYEKSHPVWRDGADLRVLAKLRNLLFHNPIRKTVHVAQPTHESLAVIEEIAEKLLHQPRAGVAFKCEVVTIIEDRSMQEVLSLVRENDFSQFPVYREQTMVALLTENGITRYLALNHDCGKPLDWSEVTVADVLAMDEGKENYVFARADDSVDDVAGKFGVSPALEAVIVTKNAKPDDRPLGVATVYGIARPVRSTRKS